MTIKHTNQSSVADSPVAVTWTAVESGLWVAKKNGEFAGLAERNWTSGFSVTNGIGHMVGEFSTLREAQESLLHTGETGAPAA